MTTTHKRRGKAGLPDPRADLSLAPTDRVPGTAELWDLITAAVGEGCPRPRTLYLGGDGEAFAVVAVDTVAQWQAWTLWMAPAVITVATYCGSGPHRVLLDCVPDLLGPGHPHLRVMVSVPSPLPDDLAAAVEHLRATVGEGLPGSRHAG